MCDGFVTNIKIFVLSLSVSPALVGSYLLKPFLLREAVRTLKSPDASDPGFVRNVGSRASLDMDQ